MNYAHSPIHGRQLVRPDISDADVPSPLGKWEKQAEQGRDRVVDLPEEKNQLDGDPFGDFVGCGGYSLDKMGVEECDLLWVEDSGYRNDCCASVSVATWSDDAWETAQEWEFEG